MNAFIRGIKTIRQVGLLPVLQVSLYRFGLITGHYRRMTPPVILDRRLPETCWLDAGLSLAKSPIMDFYHQDADLKAACLKEAEFILSGKCLIFGKIPVEIFQTDTAYTQHWTEYERKQVNLPVEDIKFIWEPARLGWIFALCRAQAAGGIPGLGPKTWDLLQRFLRLNPVNYGPNWMNGQEVALRILALVFFHEVFRDCPDLPPDWERFLGQAVIDHARRIPPTLVYARSQQNNHLLVEAAGLYTAGIFLPDHPEAGKWRDTGWQVFHQGLDDQIDDDGTYAQYSTNYHRLMLQIALWVKAISLRVGDGFPETSSRKLAAAANWLDGLTALETGRVPNYGHNDGAYILPLTGRPYEDFRPVVNTAKKFFISRQSDSAQNEMSLWFDWLANQREDPRNQTDNIPLVNSYKKLMDGSVTAFLFAPQIKRRPGQADLMHIELWRNGVPLLLDAGTYQYNAAPPWQNALSQTRVHNTLTINGADQMQKAGRFLWLDWPKVNWGGNPAMPNLIAASHDGYKRYGVHHNRMVQIRGKQRWWIVDQISPITPGEKPQIQICLNWLIPVAPWNISEEGSLSVEGLGQIRPHDTVDGEDIRLLPDYQIIHAGEIVKCSPDWATPGEDIDNLGWYSSTYGVKEPAISFRLLYRVKAPITILTEFIVC